MPLVRAYTFEGGTLGATASGGSGWPFAQEGVTYDNARVKTGTRSCRIHIDPAQWDPTNEGFFYAHATWDIPTPIGQGGAIWMGGWIYIPAGYVFHANVAKLFRFTTTGNLQISPVTGSDTWTGDGSDPMALSMTSEISPGVNGVKLFWGNLSANQGGDASLLPSGTSYGRLWPGHWHYVEQRVLFHTNTSLAQITIWHGVEDVKPRRVFHSSAGVRWVGVGPAHGVAPTSTTAYGSQPFRETFAHATLPSSGATCSGGHIRGTWNASSPPEQFEWWDDWKVWASTNPATDHPPNVDEFGNPYLGATWADGGPGQIASPIGAPPRFHRGLGFGVGRGFTRRIWAQRASGVVVPERREAA